MTSRPRITLTDNYQGYRSPNFQLPTLESDVVYPLVDALKSDSQHLSRQDLKQIIEEINISLLLGDPLPEFDFTYYSQFSQKGRLQVLMNIKEYITNYLNSSPAASFEII